MKIEENKLDYYTYVQIRDKNDYSEFLELQEMYYNSDDKLIRLFYFFI